jgi:hypothetical protein
MVLWAHFSGQIHPEKVIVKFLEEVFHVRRYRTDNKFSKRGKEQ